MSQKSQSTAKVKSRERFQLCHSDILTCLRNSRKLDTRGYQGHIHAAQIGDKKVLIKSAAGWGIAVWINRWMLRREYRSYRRLDGVTGIPHCYGFFMNRYLVLEHIEGQTMRDACIVDRETFLAEMLDIIKVVHSRGVAHGDLKRKDNILITRDSKPYLIDFGVSALRKRGFRPLNYFWHGFCHQHDFNAWLKHKYGRDLVNMSPEDASLYKPLWSERLSRMIKKFYKKLTKGRKQYPQVKNRAIQKSYSLDPQQVNRHS